MADAWVPKGGSLLTNYLLQEVEDFVEMLK